MSLQSAGALPAMSETEFDPPSVDVPGDDAPVAKIDPQALKALAGRLSGLFQQYRSDRRLQELRWLRNLRQYLGFYDPEVEKSLTQERSRAYPKITRVKCISMRARIMDLMFPSDDRNWTLKARPSPEMSAEDVKQAIAKAQARDQAAGQQPQVDEDYVMSAVLDLAAERARQTTTLIDDQLQELGGDQSYDYVALNDEVVQSGIQYGIGLLRGPYVRKIESVTWTLDAQGQPTSKKSEAYMPQFEFLRCWDFYPDLSAKRLEDTDGYFIRLVMSRRQVRKLADRPDFFGDIIKSYLASHTVGNYRALEFETELRAMGVKEIVNEQKTETTKYEIICWHGPVSGTDLRAAGVEVDDDKLSDEIDAEVWMIDGYVIKAVMNPWAEVGLDVKTIHHFLFDKDDTSPIGFGLPNVIRDTQMSISASTRMMLDNASVVCGPILELNTNLLRADQDVSSLSAYKIFYRDDDGPSAQFPAVRGVQINSHVPELQSMIKLFMEFADIETFVGPTTGGDMSKMPSEPMRNAAGASMIMGNAALPFKEIIRNFDRFTMSVIQSLVQFNRRFNPEHAPASEYDVIARGATSLIAKEIRGMQVDQLSTTLTPEERMHVDARKLVEARFRVRDLDDMLVSEDEAARRQAAADQQQAQQQQLQQAGIEANTRKLLADAFKSISLGQQHQVAANAEAVNTALGILEHGAKLNDTQSAGGERAGTGPAETNPAVGSGAPIPVGNGMAGLAAPASPGPPTGGGLDGYLAGTGGGPGLQ